MSFQLKILPTIKVNYTQKIRSFHTDNLCTKHVLWRKDLDYHQLLINLGLKNGI